MATSFPHRFGFVVTDAARLARLLCCCLPQNVDARAATFAFLSTQAKTSTNARGMGRIDAPCSLKLPAPSRGASAALALLQALGTAERRGPGGHKVTRYAVEKQPRTRPVVAVNADDAFSHSRLSAAAP